MRCSVWASTQPLMSFRAASVCVDVVDQAEAGAEARGERLEVRLLQGHPLLGERGVGDPQA